MKPCRHCGEVKLLADFYKHPQMADGHLNVCKPCRDAYVKEWQAANREKRKTIANRHAKKTRTPEKSAASWARWYAKAGPEEMAKFAERARRRNAAEMRALPSWANSFFIEEAYHLAQLRSAATGFAWEVDHMVPLQSPFVCGLHVEHNLRVIPATINRGKKNRFWPDMPEAP